MQTPLKILLVEDDKDDQFLFIEALRDIDDVNLFGVANNGHEALDILENPSSHPDLIFTDINMPLMNGIECLKEIMQNPKTRDIPVVVLSSDNTKTEEVCQLGAKAFIKKPSDGNSLLKLIKGLINFYLVKVAHAPQPERVA